MPVFHHISGLKPSTSLWVHGLRLATVLPPGTLENGNVKPIGGSTMQSSLRTRWEIYRAKPLPNDDGCTV